jgi:hypothetical protein
MRIIQTKSLIAGLVCASALVVAGGARAEQVKGGTGTGGNYRLLVQRRGAASVKEGKVVQPLDLAVSYGGGAAKYFKGAKGGTATVTLHLADQEAPVTFDVPLKRTNHGNRPFTGSLTVPTSVRAGFNGNLVTKSSIEFRSDNGKDDSDFGKGYAGPTVE